MYIDYAIKKDYEYILMNDKHIAKELIKNKILNKEIYVIKEEDNNIVGWLRYSYFWDNTPFMNMIYINDEYRAMGLGKKLVECWENQMMKKDYKMVMTSTLSNEDAQYFYRSLGYKDSGSLLLDNEPLEIIFTKKI